MELLKTRHSRYNIYYHFVWIPKYREKMLSESVSIRLKNIFYEIAKKRGLKIIALEIMPNHIHLFVSSPPQNAPSLIANWFKGISARMYNHTYHVPRIKWSNSYYVGTAGTVSKDTIQKYIREQKK